MSVIDLTTNTSYASLSAAIGGSAVNDVIAVSAGTYVEAFPDITHNLTIQAVGGLAQLSTPSSVPPNGRAILNVPGDHNVSLTISGLELFGATDGASNGAGILFETGNANLTIRNSWFHNNQDGVLVGGVDAASTAGMTVSIDRSEFNNNGTGSGLNHNLYVNGVTKLTVTNSYFHDAIGGHEIKSRALTSVIENNRIQDQASAASYNIDLPDGGVATVSGNVIEKGVNAVNRYAVHFSGEGLYAGSSLTLDNNTFIGDRPGGTTGLFNQSGGYSLPAVPATISSNTLYNIPLGNLYQDNFGPPYDSVTNNSVPTGPAPPLDQSHPFAVGEPASAWVLPLALLATAIVRRGRGRSRKRRERSGPVPFGLSQFMS